MLKLIQLTVNTWFNYIYYSWMKNIANIKSKTGKYQQVHVIPLNGKLTTITGKVRKNYNKLAKKKGLKTISHLEIIENSYYSTTNKK